MIVQLSDYSREVTMRLLHTSDWHLGHTLHDLPREYEHALFLGWLQDQIAALEVDALLIAGDIFETANPPATAQGAWYSFLAETRGRFPKLDIVAIGGNHDSAARLDAPAALLQALGVRIVGGLPRRSDGLLAAERLVAPLRGPQGEVEAWVCAVPFLRPADLPQVGPAQAVEPSESGRQGEPGEASDPLVEGVRAVYGEAIDHVRALRRPGQAIVAMGHCYMVGTVLSELSERKVLGGNQHALPADIFPADIAYAAMGHLHLAQEVGHQAHIRYSGSPIPLSLSEIGYRHQVCVVDLQAERMTDFQIVPVPRFVDLLCIPGHGAVPLPEALRLLRALPAPDPGATRESRPFLEVRISLDRPDPSANRQISEALEGKHANLVKITATYTVQGREIPLGAETTTLADLREEDVFRAIYAKNPGGEPPPDLMAAFHDLVDEVRAEEAVA